MTKRQRKLQEKNAIRDTLTNKRISNNKEVVCVENAIDYVKKQGYLVIRPKGIELFNYAFISLFILLIFIGSVSADTLGTSKTYNVTTKEISFKDVENKEIATAKLNTPQVNYVVRGKDRLISEFTLDLKVDEYKNSLKNMKFIDLKITIQKYLGRSSTKRK